MSKPRLFDAHTHTHFAAYEKDSGEVIQRALDKNIWLVNVGTQKDTSAKAVQIANQYTEGVYATVGLHPIHTEKSYHDEKELGAVPCHSEQREESRVKESTEILRKAQDDAQPKGFTSREEDFDYEDYKKLALDKKVVAIGECGLDYYRAANSKEQMANGKKKQQETFIKHIELAREIKKPLMIHCRNAFSDLIDILVNCQLSDVKCPGVVHFFSGTVNDAKRLLELGFSFSFGGVITFTRDYNEQIKYIPLDRILLETDAPYVSPIPHRGKRNEPMYVEEVAKKLAELKDVSFEEITEQTTENSLTLFNLS